MTKKAKKPEKAKKATRICRLQVDKVSGTWKETTGRWHEQQQQCQKMANRVMQLWLAWHIDKGSPTLLEEWLEERGKYQGEEKRKAGKCPVQALPKGLDKELYAYCRREYPQLHTRVTTLMINRITKGVLSTERRRKAGCRVGKQSCWGMKAFQAFTADTPSHLTVTTQSCCSKRTNDNRTQDCIGQKAESDL